MQKSPYIMAFYDPENNCYDGHCLDESNGRENIRLINNWVMSMTALPFPEDSVPPLPDGIEGSYGGDETYMMLHTIDQGQEHVKAMASQRGLPYEQFPEFKPLSNVIPAEHVAYDFDATGNTLRSSIVETIHNKRMHLYSITTAYLKTILSQECVITREERLAWLAEIDVAGKNLRAAQVEYDRMFGANLE